MAKQRKNLGDYKTKIQEYFRNNKDNKYSINKTDLNLYLGIDRKYIHDCRRRQTKWQKEFLKEYDRACNKIANIHLRDVLKFPQYKWWYLRTCHSDIFDDLSNNQNNLKEETSIKVELTNPRNIENE